MAGIASRHKSIIPRNAISQVRADEVWLSGLTVDEGGERGWVNLLRVFRQGRGVGGGLGEATRTKPCTCN